ncbi:MAG: DUF1080 domain-containing protein, partial [Planctomycetaceae bacterium]|nr:DUF1080 domain-containing protein [Planctomycetaceae bacterium]
RFQQIVSLLGDGHSGLRIRSAHVLPVRFFWFDDGLLITAVRQPHARLLGAQVLQLNGRAIDEVLAAFAPIVSHDNPMNVRAATPRMLRVTEYLAGLGLAAQTRSAELLVRLPDGSQETIRVEAEPLRDRQEGWEGWIDTLGGEAQPLSWKIRDRMLWFAPTADGRVLYAQINGMGNPRGDTFKAFSERLLQFVDAHPEINRLVLDFRRNGGGDTFLNRPLIQGLVRSRLNRPGGLAVLIGRDTFSAAQNTITEIERHTEAIFVGEPSGSRPNFIGESVEFTLPYSNHGVSISDLYWVTSSPLDRRMWIAPKVYVPPTAADFLARRDPALEAAVQGTLGVAPPTPVARTEVRVNEKPTEPTAASDSALELLRTDRELADWTVTEWSDLAKPAPAGVRWTLRDGVLQGSNPRGTWLISKAEYGDFVLEFEWKLPDRGNSGVALRAPLQGDPAFDGLEVQMVDPRYHPAEQKPQANELTGSFYRAVAPTSQVFKPNDWNRYVITCRGPQIQIVLNGQTIQDLNLDEQTVRPQRHDGTLAPPLKDRPRRGHIGFQELSRGGGQVEIRNVRLRELH